jgi:hypothetical protein
MWKGAAKQKMLSCNSAESTEENHEMNAMRIAGLLAKI